MVSVNSVNAGISAEIFYFILLFHFVCLGFQDIHYIINKGSRFFLFFFFVVDFLALNTYNKYYK